MYAEYEFNALIGSSHRYAKVCLDAEPADPQADYILTVSFVEPLSQLDFWMGAQLGADYVWESWPGHFPILGINWPASLGHFYNLNDAIPVSPRCDHLVGIHSFLYEHQLIAIKEHPYITPWWLPDEIPSYAVLHALPMCKPTAKAFVPCATIMSLTYFSSERDRLMREHYKSEWAHAEREGDREYRPGHVYDEGDAQRDATARNLAYWAERGQLGWLDVTNPDLPLRIGVGSTLPSMYKQMGYKP